MKTLVFSPYYPPHIGGLESHADEFNKYLSQKGVAITVFTPRLPFDAPENETKHNGVEIIRFPAFEIIPNYPLPKFWHYRFWKLFCSLFRKKFDFVISRTRFFNTSLLALIHSKVKRVKWMHIEHGSDYVKLNNPLSSMIAKAYDHTFGWLVLKSCDKLVANSQASGKFCEKIAKRKAKIIYRGVGIEKIENAVASKEIREKYSDGIIISYMGRLIDGKGVSDLVESAKDIKGNFYLFIIGDGPQRENIQNLIKKYDLSRKVELFGHQKHIEAIKILRASDIFVNPSYTEGLPTSVIEAALLKKAIVATNVGGTPEIITDQKSGFLIEPKNINLLREKINFLINNKEARDKLGTNAYNEVKAKFSWDKSIEKYLSIFSSL